MPYQKVVEYLILLVFFIIPFRQYKTNYFYYFLVLGLSEIASYLSLNFFNLSPIYPYILVSYLLFISVIPRNMVKAIWYLVLLGAILFSFIPRMLHNYEVNYWIFISLHILIILRISYLTLGALIKERKISLFLIVLIFYELTVLTKFMNVFANVVNAQNNFLITTGLEIFIGLFFIVYREDNAKLVFQY